MTVVPAQFYGRGGATGAVKPNRAALEATRSPELKEYPPGKGHARSIYGYVPHLLIAFVVVLFLIIQFGSSSSNGSSTAVSNTGQLLADAALLFGAAFVLAGWSEFSLYQILANIPTAKIGSSALGSW